MINILVGLIVAEQAGAHNTHHSKRISAYTTKSEAGYCVECDISRAQTQKQAQNLRMVRSAVTGANPAGMAAFVIENSGWGRSCDKFADGNSYGMLGQVITSEIHTGEYEVLMEGTPDLKRLCRSYDQMSRAEKEGLWVVIIAGMSFYESSCNANPPKHRGPFGILQGILQLHRGMEHYYSQSCKRNSSAKEITSIPCAMSMLRKQMGSNDALFSRRSYWEVLRPQARIGKAARIANAIKRYPYCH